VGGIAVEKTTTSSETFIDPVCMMEVDSGRQNLMFTYQMRTYYFCAEACRNAFKANPEKYLKLKAPKRKGLWGRYLERLNKVTGGKAQQCHG
jgi:YHS domain-containing protein